MISIITPSLQRETLVDTCLSIDTQRGDVEWEHVIMVDQEEFNPALLKRIEHPRRSVYKCPVAHRDGGNSCRRNAWHMTSHAWVAYMDDDNYYADDQVFADIAAVLSPLPETVKWALFPIRRLGHVFYADPPRSCHVDTMNFILRREIAQWPDTNAYGSDGIMIDRLMDEKIPYAAFPNFRPIAVLPKINFCQ